MRYKTTFKTMIEAEKELENMLCDDTYRYLHCVIWEEQDKHGHFKQFRIGKEHELRLKFNIDTDDYILRPL